MEGIAFDRTGRERGSMKTELYQEYIKYKAMLTLGFVHPHYEEWLEKQVASLRSAGEWVSVEDENKRLRLIMAEMRNAIQPAYAVTEDKDAMNGLKDIVTLINSLVLPSPPQADQTEGEQMVEGFDLMEEEGEDNG